MWIEQFNDGLPKCKQRNTRESISQLSTSGFGRTRYANRRSDRTSGSASICEASMNISEHRRDNRKAPDSGNYRRLYYLPIEQPKEDVSLARTIVSCAATAALAFGIPAMMSAAHLAGWW